MRVLLLAPAMSAIGGVERLVARLSSLLAEQHEVHIASFDPPGTAPAVPLAVPFHPLGGERPRPLPLRPLTYTAQLSRLRRLERAERIEVTISNLWRADAISALAGGGVRRVALAHIAVAGNPTNRLMLRFRPLVAALYRRLDRVVAVSSVLAAELGGLYRLRPERVATIPNFVSMPDHPGVATRIPGRLVWVGRMVPEKVLPALVAIVAEMAARGRPVSLDVVGDGPERKAAERAAATAPHAIRFLGPLADPLPVIAAAAALALPSRSEGLPTVLLEALALGTPVLAADCAGGGAHEALGARSSHDLRREREEQVAAGVLLPVPDTAAQRARWTAAIDALLFDPPRLAAAGAAARAAGSAYTPEAVAARWHRLLAELPA